MQRRANRVNCCRKDFYLVTFTGCSWQPGVLAYSPLLFLLDCCLVVDKHPKAVRAVAGSSYRVLINTLELEPPHLAPLGCTIAGVPPIHQVPHFQPTRGPNEAISCSFMQKGAMRQRPADLSEHAEGPTGQGSLSSPHHDCRRSTCRAFRWPLLSILWVCGEAAGLSIACLGACLGCRDFESHVHHHRPGGTDDECV